MGPHKVWRKIAKKQRRKRIRAKLAQERDEHLRIEEERLLNCPRYQTWLKEQEALEAFQEEEEKRQSEARELKWFQDEEVAQIAWRERQRRAAEARQEKELQISLLKEQIKEEERKKQEELDIENEEKELAQLKQENLKKAISDYIEGKVNELPLEVVQSSETHPGKEECPFFSKVGACRFFDRCSRNHIRPGISKVLLFHGLYSHFSLMSHGARSREYDTDITLEFDTFDTYKDFDEFFKDVVGEMKKIGNVVLVKVCKNSDIHLRGNVYVQFKTERDALRAYSALCGRYYAGRQLSPIFVLIPSWKNALCGQQWSKKCHKGSLCNFLHVFSNPRGELSRYDKLSDSDSPNNRWSSESPEQRGDSRSSRRSSRERNRTPHKRRESSRASERSRSDKRESARSNKINYSDRRRDSDRKKSVDLKSSRPYNADRRRNGHSRNLSRNSSDKDNKFKESNKWISRDSNAPGWSSSSEEETKEIKTKESKKKLRKRRKRSRKSDSD